MGIQKLFSRVAFETQWPQDPFLWSGPTNLELRANRVPQDAENAGFWRTNSCQYKHKSLQL